MKELRRTWGRSIRAHRKSRGMSQTELAYLCGVTTASVSRWESGGAITDENKIKVAKVLSVDVWTLFPLMQVAK